MLVNVYVDRACPEVAQKLTKVAGIRVVTLPPEALAKLPPAALAGRYVQSSMSSSVLSEPLVDNPGTTETPDFPAGTRVYLLEADLRVRLLEVAKTLATRLSHAQPDEYLCTTKAIETLVNTAKSLEPR